MAESASRNFNTHSKTVDMISCGVVFEFNQEIKLGADNWAHLFVINLPRKVFKGEQLFLKFITVVYFVSSSYSQ